MNANARTADVTKHIIIYFLVRCSNGILALASIYLLSRLLSAQEYGLYALALATANILAAVFYQWLALGVGRFLSSYGEHPGGFLAQVRGMHFGCSIVLLLGLGLWGAFSSSEYKVEGAVAGFTAVLLGAYNLHLQILNANHEARRYALLSNARAVLAVVLSCSFAFLGFGALGAIGGLALGLSAAVIIFGYSWDNKHTPVRSERGAHQQLFSFGIPLTLTSAATMMLDYSDRFLIALWHGSDSVASYSVAYELAMQSVGAILNVFYLAGYPRVALAWESGGRDAAQRAVAPLSNAVFFFSPVVAGLFICFSSEIATLMIGNATRANAAQIIPWAAVAITIGCIKSYVFDVGLHLQRRTKRLLQITIGMALCNVAFNLILIPQAGVVGAAISSTCALIIGAVSSYFYGRSAGVYVKPARDVVSALLSLASMIIAASICQQALSSLEPVQLAIYKLGVVGIAFAVSAMILNLGGSRNLVLAYSRTRLLRAS